MHKHMYIRTYSHAALMWKVMRFLQTRKTSVREVAKQTHSRNTKNCVSTVRKPIAVHLDGLCSALLLPFASIETDSLVKDEGRLIKAARPAASCVGMPSLGYTLKYFAQIQHPVAAKAPFKSL